MYYICIQSNGYVTVTYVYDCHMSNLPHVQTKQNHQIDKKIQRKPDTVGSSRPGVATIQDLLHYKNTPIQIY